MFSLLQHAGYSLLQTEARTRRALVVLLASGLVSSLGIISLAPAFIEARMEVPGASLVKKLMSSSAPAPEDATKKAPNLTDAAAAAAYELESISPILLAIAEEVTAMPNFLSLAVSVRQTFLNHADVAVAHMTANDKGIIISGTARNRSTLLALDEQLRQDKHFATVNFPFSSLTGREGEYPFTFTCTFAEKK